MPEAILGISAYYHDSAAAILVDGKIIAAAQEERFTRKKHDAGFPTNAVRYVLEESGFSFDELKAVAFYDKPYLKFERLLETYHSFAPRGFKSFAMAMPAWIREKLFIKSELKKGLKLFGSKKIPLYFPEHHLSHGASAFYPSPFQDAAILTVDGVGEWATTTLAHGEGNKIKILSELHFPHSLGLLYSAFTYYIGFKVNSGEYKLMGLAPYGDPSSHETEKFKELIYKELIDLKEDGSILLNMKYFDFATGLKMSNDSKWTELFGFGPKKADSGELEQKHMNLALAIQQVTEEIMLRLARTVKKLSGSKNLVMAGGVALNSVANGKILKEGIFDKIWIQPAAGDAGGSVGAAQAVWHILMDKPREISQEFDSMQGAYLGPRFENRDVESVLKKFGASAEHYSDTNRLLDKVSDVLADGKVVGWFQGRMEFGPRALGGRSILGDARNPEMQKKMNLKIKFREGFRPFAPSVLEEDLEEYFDLKEPSPYMLMVVPLQNSHRKTLPENYHSKPLYERLYYLRSDLPAITHVDFSARLQSVSQKTNPRYWQLLNAFKKKTGYSVLVNTSFNVRGEPIVCTPEDAFRCFMRTEMDYLVVEDYIFDKSKQGDLRKAELLQESFEAD